MASFRFQANAEMVSKFLLRDSHIALPIYIRKIKPMFWRLRNCATLSAPENKNLMFVVYSGSQTLLSFITRLFHKHPGYWALLRPWINSMLAADVPGHQFSLSSQFLSHFLRVQEVNTQITPFPLPPRPSSAGAIAPVIYLQSTSTGGFTNPVIGQPLANNSFYVYSKWT